jgi:hypothetical protein
MGTHLIGTVVSDRVLRARWAYGELRSDRFRKRYVGRGPSHLLDNAAQGIPFEQLSPQDVTVLAQMVVRVRGRPFACHVDGSTYRCEAWTREQLLQVMALPVINPPERKTCIAYRRFLSAPPTSTAGGRPQATDPRFVIRTIPAEQRFEQQEPVIVVRRGRHLILLEGYLRSLHFLRSNDPNDRLLVWVPEAGPVSP